MFSAYKLIRVWPVRLLHSGRSCTRTEMLFPSLWSRMSEETSLGFSGDHWSMYSVPFWSFVIPALWKLINPIALSCEWTISCSVFPPQQIDEDRQLQWRPSSSLPLMTRLGLSSSVAWRLSCMLSASPPHGKLMTVTSRRLFGVTTMQTGTFYRRSRKDSLALRITVSTLLFATQCTLMLLVIRLGVCGKCFFPDS